MNRSLRDLDREALVEFERRIAEVETKDEDRPDLERFLRDDDSLGSMLFKERR